MDYYLVSYYRWYSESWSFIRPAYGDRSAICPDLSPPQPYVISNQSADWAIGSAKFSSYLSLDQDYDEGIDFLTDEVEQTNLAIAPSGVFSVFNGSYDFSSYAPPGSYYMLVYADKDNTLPETNESNNTGVDAVTKIVLPGTGVKNADTGRPRDWFLFQNGPNPFNSTTIISWQIAEETDVTLEIYDLRRRQLLYHTAVRQQPGCYTYRWESGQCGSGIYLYRLQSGGRVFIKKMVLQK